MDPEIRELRVFLALVEARSFSAAAKRLGITQPAVSACVLELEQRIGFPLFHRGSDGAALTTHGEAMLPLVREVEEEYGRLLTRAGYWQRAHGGGVRLHIDGSRQARLAADDCRLAPQERHELASGSEWTQLLLEYQTDLVIAGSFLQRDSELGIHTMVLREEAGITLAWSPESHPAGALETGFAEIFNTTLILPARRMAVGFREFLEGWCETVYHTRLNDVIECESEREAVERCRMGLGVLAFPGDAEVRLDLGRHGLKSRREFVFLLPKAFRLGVRLRPDERAPAVLAMAERLTRTPLG